ncbi:MAG: DNA-processing protein DprA [Phycisphaerae bacterium]|jgi:DNA processing protein
MRNSPNIEKWLRLIRSDGVGPVTFAKLLAHFGSVDRALSATLSELVRVNDIGEKTARSIIATREKFDAEAELALAEKLGIWLVHLQDDHYPTLLRRITDPPPVLYVKGTLENADNLAVAIVGSRRCSTYGSEQSSRLAHILAATGFTIISGLARGIDTAAHHGALSAGGRTIAVQGCGLAKIFPPENEKLADAISQSGAIVSELPLNYDPLAENFPPRNRLVAGLALGTIVIEAAPRSGALITASASLDYNREVMAVPGKVDSPLSKGTHQLLKQGARLVENAEDVIETLGYIGAQIKDHAAATGEHIEQGLKSKTAATAGTLVLSVDEKKILNSLDCDPLHLDDIITASDLPAGTVHSILVCLQLKGLVKSLPGSFFQKK